MSLADAERIADARRGLLHRLGVSPLIALCLAWLALLGPLFALCVTLHAVRAVEGRHPTRAAASSVSCTDPQARG